MHRTALFPPAPSLLNLFVVIIVNAMQRGRDQ